ncbi:MAG: DUF2946 family protein [Isosphaeraceae bacterium]
MIRRRANQLLVATILTLYGVITVGGPALHALPGFGHDFAKLASTRNHSSRTADQENAAHDCPICHFHAQGQVIADPDSAPCIEVVRIRPVTEPPLASRPAVVRPTIPRAPPLV